MTAILTDPAALVATDPVPARNGLVAYSSGVVAGRVVEGLVSPLREDNTTPVAESIVYRVPVAMEDVTAALWMNTERCATIARTVPLDELTGNPDWYVADAVLTDTALLDAARHSHRRATFGRSGKAAQVAAEDLTDFVLDRYEPADMSDAELCAARLIDHPDPDHRRATARLAGHTIAFPLCHRENSDAPASLMVHLEIPVSVDDVTAALWMALDEDGWNLGYLLPDCVFHAITADILTCPDTVARTRRALVDQTRGTGPYAYGGDTAAFLYAYATGLLNPGRANPLIPLF